MIAKPSFFILSFYGKFMDTQITPQIAETIMGWVANGFICAICEQRKPFQEIGFNYHVTAGPEPEYRPVCSKCNRTNFICEKGCSHKGKGRGITQPLEDILNEVQNKLDRRKNAGHLAKP